MPNRAQEVIPALDAVNPEAFSDNEVERLQVRAATRRLLARVETPYERAWGFCFEHPVVFAALQTCIDLGLWESWTSTGGYEKSINEPVQLTNATIDTNLLRKPHCHVNIIQQDSLKAYRPALPLASSLQHCRGDSGRQF